MAKPDDFNKILDKLNSFDNNLSFTIDIFEDNSVHFLDLKIDETETDLFYKPTHTGEYCHFTSQTPWRLKTAWIKALFHRATKICSSNDGIKCQLSKIKLFMSWNGYPSDITRSLFARLQSKKVTTNESVEAAESSLDVFIKIPYADEKGEQLLRGRLRKLRRFTKKNTRFIFLFQTKELSMFCPTKDKVSSLLKSNVIYKLVCPGCGESYIGKTDRCLKIRLSEHRSRNDQHMFVLTPF